MLTKQYVRSGVFLKAIRIHEQGGHNKLCYEEVPAPELASPVDVIVALKAAALNEKDIFVRRGGGDRKATAILPQILGGDGAGVVVETGPAVETIKIGDPVCLYPVNGCGLCELCATDREFMCGRLRVLGESEPRTCAEYIRVPARNCFRMPADLSFYEAAALPSAHLAAWRLLVSMARLKPGNSVLVRGIGSAVTNAAMQIAIQFGCHVIVTSASGKKRQSAGEFGADCAVDDRQKELAKQVRNLTDKRGVDVVLDNIGGDGWAISLACLARGGCLVTAGGSTVSQPPTDLRRIFWNQLRIFGSTLGSRAEFCQVLNFTKTTQTKPIIDQVYALKDAALAQQRLEQGNGFGKIVLRMDN